MQFIASVAALLATATVASGAAAAVTAIGPGGITPTYVNDFETVKNSGLVTFDGASVLVPACAAAACTTTSGDQGLLSGDSPFVMTANLSASYSAVGLWFGNDDTCCSGVYDARLTVFSGATNLGSVTVTANMNDFVDQFIGLTSDTPFDRVQIDYGGVNLYVFIDDFQLGAAAVPEPATWALMIGGFGLAGSSMRRKRSDTAFA